MTPIRAALAALTLRAYTRLTRTERRRRCQGCGRADGGCDRVVTVDITPDASRVTQSLEDLVFKANPDNIALWESYFGRKLTPWERAVFTAPGLNKRDVEIPPHNLRQRLDDMTTEAVNDAVGEWWREDSGDRYPGRGGW